MVLIWFYGREELLLLEFVVNSFYNEQVGGKHTEEDFLQ